MNTNKKNGEDFFLDITYLRCFMALKIIKDEFGIKTFKPYKHILSDIMEEYHLWKSIDDKEFLSRIGLENEIENPKLTNLINKVDLCYVSCDRIYDFGSTEIIPYSNRRYFLLITICLNNFNDINIEKILAYQFSIYPNKENFLKNLRLTVREHADKIIPYHKAQTVIEWIDNNKILPPKRLGINTKGISNIDNKPSLTINQIALKYVYEGVQITRKNSNEIIKGYGHKSGEKLFQKYTYYSSTANRKGKPTPCTPKKLDNKIRLIESVIEILPTDKQSRAKDEVSILKKIQREEY